MLETLALVTCWLALALVGGFTVAAVVVEANV